MKKVIITGACGFIGSCLSLKLIEQGVAVIGIDNLSRRGAKENAEELAHPLFSLHTTDLSRTDDVLKLFAELGEVDAVFHLSGQVAVTTSYVDRRQDFRGNAMAGFNVIEAVKRHTPGAYCLYSSTNKVYGHITTDKPVGLDLPLLPYTPYGVSKAVGELYFTEYGRAELGLTTCCLRQSCIYGHHQVGVEDQGWMAWFAIANMFDVPVTIYGDGKQVRDLLYIDDLLDLYLECAAKRVSGVFPVGGGPYNAVTLTEGLQLIETATGRKFDQLSHEAVRPGDQPYFVADVSCLAAIGLAWRPRTSPACGIARMVAWIDANRTRIGRILAQKAPAC